ncbi:MAG TPA: isoprenylcysteine carboxylmethyltransferase family protein [Candidatus Binataceae bacterium]|jgi:protein-S-isoprenylcysteine O-methyltransferase Ste14|nr:isoprenylcysteine carboxylmethyltransferase family protein [Candidatus Binataceae bacterium]
MNARKVITVIFNFAIFGALLFGPAGTLACWRAWVLLGVVLIASILTMGTAFRGNEELLNERFKSPIQKDQPLADKIIVIVFVTLFFGLVVMIPLDVFRWHWLTSPGPAVSSAGIALFVIGWWLIALSLGANRFAAPVVKYQAERQQAVIAAGPYRLIRHPMYAGGVLIMIGMPLWLGSYTATILAGLPILALAIRIVFEEQFLRRELQGYSDYATRIRYRLVPFLW